MSSDRRSGTRLPEDPAYWDDLAARSIEAAFGSSSASAGAFAASAGASAASAGASAVAHVRGGAAFDPWWRGISDAAYVLAASAVLGLLGGSLLLDERSPRTAAGAHALTGALAPDDPLLASLLDTPVEPPASALLRLVALRGEAQ